MRPNPTRRDLLRGGLILGGGRTLKTKLFAQELLKTAATTEGPFYPDKMPLDTDSDLLIISESTTQALGEITHLTGRVLDINGKPLAGLIVEIWQVDGNGVYIHSGSGNAARRDKNFQGFGRTTTGEKGEYRFRTIKPVPYPGRTPHIHFKVKNNRRDLITSQIFVAGQAQNASDGVLRGVRDPLSRELLMAEFKPMKESKIGELSANFDIVIGYTPNEP